MKKLMKDGTTVNYPDGTSSGAMPGGIVSASITANNLIAYNNSMIGRVLTVIDATGLEPSAKKATKDLIKQAMWEHFDHVKAWMEAQDDERGIASSFPYAYMSSLDQ